MGHSWSNGMGHDHEGYDGDWKRRALREVDRARRRIQQDIREARSRSVADSSPDGSDRRRAEQAREDRRRSRQESARRRERARKHNHRRRDKARAKRHDDHHENREAKRQRARLTAEERAYRVARRRANAKLSVMIHLVAFCSVILFLFFVAGFRAATITGMSWGIGLSMHWFIVVIAPGLRQRWIDEEVRNQVHSTVSSERQVLEGKHARSLEELSASLAHEIRNPITAAKSLVQQLGEDPSCEDNVEYAGVALEELDRVERSISHLLRFAREEEVALAEMHMGDAVDSALATVRDRLDRLDVQIQREIDSDGVMQGDAEKLRRVIINLINNSLDALEEAETSDPRLNLTSGENLAGTEVWIRIRDNGPGMDADDLEKIFKPFYTSKKSGTGLGLAISKKLVDAHGGTIEATSSPDEGTEFVLTFPKQRPADQ
ncbi:MAG: HAMP domain-containing histidine kinase [bacterium]|nr:HAMP domain-containing histidine kinase [bacterium]